MAGIQFIGRDNAVKAFTSKGVDTWAVFSKKDLNHSGSGADELEQYLTMLEPHGAGCIYTLKVYRGDVDPDYITDKTESNGSFNFKLSGSSAAVGSVGTVSGDPIYQKLHGVIAAKVSEAIDKMLNGEKEEEEPETIGSVVMGYLQDPNKLIPIIGLVSDLLKGRTPNTSAVPFSIGALEQNNIKRVSPDMGEIERIAAVIDRLQAADPKILEHLEKLAQVAETKPQLFAMLLTNLESL